MKYLLLLAAVSLYGATPYNFGTTLRLDNGAETLRVTHTVDGVEQSFVVLVPLPLNGATYQKVTAWSSKYYVAGKSETTCANPCNVRMPLQYGPPKLTVQRFDGSNNSVGVAGIVPIPQYIPAPLTSYTMPIEMVGFEGYTQGFRVTTRGTADLSGAERLYLRIHRPAYEGKAQVRVNGGAWTDVKRSNVTLMGTHATWTQATSLDFGQSLLEVTLALSDGLVTAGANDIWFKFAKEARDQSGFRVLDMNFLEANKTVSSVAISGSTVTCISTGHTYTTGDDVYISNYPGEAWRVNGAHTISVTDANTFTFTIGESDGKKAGTKTYAGVSVARMQIPLSDFTEENPATWAAPTGGVSANGETRWAANDLLGPEFPGQVITASCADCHATNGFDLKYFNYSNKSIIVRSMFHGLNEQQGKDIAAWIRGRSTTAPGRPYNPVYQPCPAALTASAYDWSGTCSYKDVLPNNAGMIPELFGDTIEEADWEPTRTGAHPAQQRINLQLLDWNDWLPLLHPKDTYSTPANSSTTYLYWPTSVIKTNYDLLKSGFTGNCPGAGCAAYITANFNALFNRFSFINNKRLTSGETLNGQPNCVGNPSDAECANNLYTASNEASKRIYSVGLWGMAKTWEIMHEFELEQYGQSAYFTRTQVNRNAFTENAFQSSFNLAKAIGANGTIPGMFDGTLFTEKVMSMVWYQYQAAINRDNNQKVAGQGMFNGIAPIDWPYTAGYFKDLAQRGIDLPIIAAQWLMLANQRYQNASPDWDGFSTGYLWTSVNVSMLTSSDYWAMWEGLPAEDRATWRTAIIDTLWTKNTNIWCGVDANGTAAAFTIADWNDRSNADSGEMPIKTNIQVGTAIQEFPSLLWHMILMGRAFGVNSGTLDQLTTCGAQWTGPSATLASAIDASQTNFSVTSVPTDWTSSPFRIRVDSEDMDCTRSGTAFTCTRGTNSTTAASHSSGTTAQIQIRWSSARNDGTCDLPNGIDVNASCYQTPTP